MNDKQKKLNDFIGAVPHLPPTPTIMVELLGLFEQPDRDIDQVVALINHDPSLTAEVLRRCNSAFFGGAEPAADMFEAVSRLGFYEVYCVVVALFGARALWLPEAEAALPVSALWEHSVTAAVTAGVVAKESHESEGPAFTAGLLHDVGKVVLLAGDRSNYAELLRKAGISGPALIEAEQEFFGFDHSEAGACLLAQWGLPANVVAAVRHHHELVGAEPFERLAATVHFGNLMAHHISDTLVTAPSNLPGSEASLAVLRLAPDRASTLVRTQRVFERIKTLLSI